MAVSSIPQERYYFSVSGTHFWRLRKPQGVVRLEELGILKCSFTFSGVEPATFRLDGECLNNSATAYRSI
jgi:hypothetical protein